MSRMKRKTRRLRSGLRAIARRTADLDVAAVGVVDALVGDVGAVDGEAGDHLPQRLPEGVEGEVARAAASSGPAGRAGASACAARWRATPA